MRGSDIRTGDLFSYVDLEQRVPANHPLRLIRRIACRSDGREITGKVYRGHLFACLLLDRHPIFYVHEGMPFSMPRVIASL